MAATLVAAVALGTFSAQAGASRSKPSTPSTPYIVGGSQTTADQHPFQAALIRNPGWLVGGNSRQICGGSLITPQLVLTAAHCLADTDPDCGPKAGPDYPETCTLETDPEGDGTPKLDPDDLFVTVGRTDLSTGVGGTEHDVLGTYVAPAYKSGVSFKSDLGYISLLDASTQPTIDIVDRNDGPLWRKAAPTRTSGYGRTAAGGETSPILKVAMQRIVSDPACGARSVFGKSFDPVTMICAGQFAGGMSACQGDSGGPLQTELLWPATRLVGVVSWGLEQCDRPGGVGVYARVAQNPLCTEVVQTAANIAAVEGHPSTSIEPVVGPAGCSDQQLKKASKCAKKSAKKKKKGKGKKRKGCGKKKKGKRRKK